MIAVNLRAPFRLSAVIGARMADGDGGVIINVGSVASEWPRPDAVPSETLKALAPLVGKYLS